MRHGALVLPLLAAITFTADEVAADTKLPPADASAAFKAAGFKQQGRKCVACPEGRITDARDVNGVGLPEVVTTETGTACHGNTGEGYSLVSKQANGSWTLVSQGTGILEFLKGPKAGGWPDVQVGGPGPAFPSIAGMSRRTFSIDTSTRASVASARRLVASSSGAA